MLYIENKQSNLDQIFSIIGENYAKKEEVPNYREQLNGIAKYAGILETVRSDQFYPSLFDKASYLLIQINKGHFFSNGNKRLSLMTALIFIVINDYWFIGEREQYFQKVMELFPTFDRFDHDPNFKPYEFGLYNLSIIIAANNEYEPDFDLLKNKVNDFLKTFLLDLK